MFRNREEAAFELAERLKGRDLLDPLVLAIPRGGVVIGAVLAQELGADLDVVLARKLRAPGHPELAIGAISETDEVYLDPRLGEVSARMSAYLAEEQRYQWAEIVRRKRLFRKIRPPLPITDRSVIVTDDGIATGATISAALQTIRAHQPHELIVAVPVIAPDSLEKVQRRCDEVVYLLRPIQFAALGEFYEDFTPVDDEQVLMLLREYVPTFGVGAAIGAKP